MSTGGTTSPRPFAIGGMEVPVGRKVAGELPAPALVTGTATSLPVQIAHGTQPGPALWLSAAIHGDEINGVEIIRQVMDRLDAKTLAGTVVAVPIVNPYGFINESRYLPDRRDLNRSFPGSSRGSLASRLARLFMTEVVDRCQYGIDLHTGSDNRNNLPQIRADLNDPTTEALAVAFGAPVMMHASLRDGSLREAAKESGAAVLLFEGGENSRFDQASIDYGCAGIRRVMAHLAMTKPTPDNSADTGQTSNRPVVRSNSSTWVRARRSGIVLLDARLGQMVHKGQVLGVIHDAFGRRLSQVTSRIDGLVVGRLERPLVNQGDALVHIATLVETPAPTNDGEAPR